MIILGLFVVFLLIDGPEGRVCPVPCECDLWDGAKRVSCIDKRLASIDLDVPTDVNAIDLSHNVINTVHDYGFKNMNVTSLQYINLSHNFIGHLSLRSFDGVPKLTHLDLSHNSLQDLPKDAFRSNERLQTLILSGNKFAVLRPKPIFKSVSLQNLYLSNCLISHIYEETFSELPLLTTIDLNGNLLVEIDKNVFRNNLEATTINIRNNPLTCDTEKTKSLKYFCLTNVIVCRSNCFEDAMQKIVIDQSNVEVKEVRIPWTFEEENETTTPQPVRCIIPVQREECPIVVPVLIAFVCGLLIGTFNTGLCWFVVWFEGRKGSVTVPQDDCEELLDLDERSYRRFGNRFT